MFYFRLVQLSCFPTMKQGKQAWRWALQICWIYSKYCSLCWGEGILLDALLPQRQETQPFCQYWKESTIMLLFVLVTATSCNKLMENLSFLLLFSCNGGQNWKFCNIFILCKGKCAGYRKFGVWFLAYSFYIYIFIFHSNKAFSSLLSFVNCTQCLIQFRYNMMV